MTTNTSKLQSHTSYLLELRRLYITETIITEHNLHILDIMSPMFVTHMHKYDILCCYVVVVSLALIIKMIIVCIYPNNQPTKR